MAPRATPRPAAFFDVDGTLTRSDVFRDLVAFRADARPGLGHAAWMAGHPVRGLALLALDRVSRPAVNRATCRWYRGHSPDDLRDFAERFQRGPGRERLYRGAIDLLRLHADLGHRLVFVTGSIDLFVEPLVRSLEEDLAAGPADAPRAGHDPAIRLEAIRLEERGGRFTGEVVGEPVGGEEKARLVAEVAREEGLDLARSHAYGDSIADLPLLESVGRPAAVNPDSRLLRTARRRGWPVLHLRHERSP